MAEYLVHSMLRTGDFPYPQTPYFSDVPASHPKFKWIQKLFEMGITAGCGDLRFLNEGVRARAFRARESDSARRSPRSHRASRGSGPRGGGLRCYFTRKWLISLSFSLQM